VSWTTSFRTRRSSRLAGFLLLLEPSRDRCRFNFDWRSLGRWVPVFSCRPCGSQVARDFCAAPRFDTRRFSAIPELSSPNCLFHDRSFAPDFRRSMVGRLHGKCRTRRRPTSEIRGELLLKFSTFYLTNPELHHGLLGLSVFSFEQTAPSSTCQTFQRAGSLKMNSGSRGAINHEPTDHSDH
jgi:hypothetical protein